MEPELVTDHDPPLLTVTVYATIDGVRSTARWSSGAVHGDRALTTGLAEPISDPLEFINECERVAGGPVGVAIGQLADHP